MPVKVTKTGRINRPSVSEKHEYRRAEPHEYRLGAPHEYVRAEQHEYRRGTPGSGLTKKIRITK